VHGLALKPAKYKGGVPKHSKRITWENSNFKALLKSTVINNKAYSKQLKTNSNVKNILFKGFTQFKSLILLKFFLGADRHSKYIGRSRCIQRIGRDID
jgi:hypothetical protein